MTNRAESELPAGIVVLGMPRSGTTLLRRLLDAHPDIACPGETNLLGACGRFLRGDRGAEGLEVGVLSGLAMAGFEESEVVESLREFAFSFFQRHAATQGKARWAEKSAFDVFYLDAIDRLCSGHVQFVCVVRHGLDVACSLEEFSNRTQGYLQELHEYVVRHSRPLEAFTHAWADRTAALLDFADAHTEDSLLVRYEDLVERPAECLQRLAGFLRCTPDDAWLARAFEPKPPSGFGDWKTYSRTSIDAASVARWKNLPPILQGALAQIANPVLERCRYETIPTREITAEEARHQYELGLQIQAMKQPRPTNGE